ncbi:uncharacterized protein LOC128804402 [Vidua macroura]|uniref:uncharacterized protein LOC128804402 n=1 Tax=Vidua macroura TaxID=187451 RepID=UPI0023A862DA|nr:uncharacterized protein LOC128804402 [Vidua macroura]
MRPERFPRAAPSGLGPRRGGRCGGGRGHLPPAPGACAAPRQGRGEEFRNRRMRAGAASPLGLSPRCRRRRRDSIHLEFDVIPQPRDEVIAGSARHVRGAAIGRAGGERGARGRRGGGGRGGDGDGGGNGGTERGRRRGSPGRAAATPTGRLPARAAPPAAPRPPPSARPAAGKLRQQPRVWGRALRDRSGTGGDTHGGTGPCVGGQRGLGGAAVVTRTRPPAGPVCCGCEGEPACGVSVRFTEICNCFVVTFYCGSLVKVQPVEQSPCRGLYNSAGASPEEATKLIRGLGHLPYRDRLENWGVYPGEEKDVWRPQNTFQNLKRLARKLETNSSSGTGVTGQGGQYKLEKGKFRLDIRKKFFTLSVVRPWHGVPRAAGAAPGSLAVPKARLDTGAWSSLGQWRVSLPWQGGVERDDLPTLTVL